MNNPFDSNSAYGSQHDPVIVPPQGNIQGVQPPSSGAVSHELLEFRWNFAILIFSY